MSTDVIAGVAPALDGAKTAGLFSPPDSKKRMTFDDSDSELSELDEEGYSIVTPPKVPDAEVVAEPMQLGEAVGQKETAEVVDDKKPEEAAADEKEPEVDDIGEVVPDHYADDGRVPVFKPTMHQFKDFQVYVRSPATVSQA